MLVTDIFSNISTNLLSSLGLIKTNEGGYYCTPKNAVTFASLGVDGIHFCIIPDENDLTLESSPVYVVSPMDFGNHVNIIARNFYDFISLVIETKDATALECISCFSRERFSELFQDIQQDAGIDTEVEESIAALHKAFHGNINKIDDVYAYVKELQAETDLSKLQYTEEYYELNSEPDFNIVSMKSEMLLPERELIISNRLDNWKIGVENGTWLNGC